MDETQKLPPITLVFPDQRAVTDAYRVAWQFLTDDAPAQALEVIEPALAEDPDNTGLRMLRAWALFDRAQLDKARDELTHLVEVDPTDVWARHTLGRVLERKSEYDAALPHLKLAAVMSADPEHEAAVLRVERLAGRIG